MTAARLVQHRDDTGRRRGVLADEEQAVFPSGPSTIREPAERVIGVGGSLRDAARSRRTADAVDLAVELDAGRPLPAIA